MIDIRRFRKSNSLTQNDLADFLGTSQSAISQWEGGITKVPEEIVETLLNNDKGWDVKALIESPKPLEYKKENFVCSGKVIEPRPFKSVEEYEETIKRMEITIAKLEAVNEEYWKIIKSFFDTVKSQIDVNSIGKQSFNRPSETNTNR